MSKNILVPKKHLAPQSRLEPALQRIKALIVNVCANQTHSAASCFWDKSLAQLARPRNERTPVGVPIIHNNATIRTRFSGIKVLTNQRDGAVAQNPTNAKV